ncbi:MAG: 4Fe-4S binding protein [Acidobacteria bacterium]|nr:4Fe-4S binding protein [Acidobacteriota bacterium]
MLGLALVFGTILSVAHRFLHVDEDPRIDTVADMLPGSNCGACGEPGCRAFAEKLVSAAAQPAGCSVSATEQVDEIAAFLGVDAGERVKLVARLHCGGGRGLALNAAEYSGMSTCGAAALVNGGNKACEWGCLGLADCQVACTFDAIQMNERLLPVVHPDLCTACGDCVVACPKDLFTLEPISQPLLVQCKAPTTGEAARAVCTVACDGCGRCVADAGEGVMVMEQGLPVIVQPLLTSRSATFRCPSGAIAWVEGSQFAFEAMEV